MSESRNRTSCEPCRKRKIKCDASFPCSSCVLRKVEKTCHFHSAGNDPSPNADAGATSTSTLSPDHPPKRRKHAFVNGHEPASAHSSADLQSMKASVRRIQAHIESLENKLGGDIHETNDPQERDNWMRVRAVIPDTAIVEVLLEYLLQECDWLWDTGDIVGVWKTTISRGGVSSALAGVLCMSLAMPALFLGPYQTPLYRLPIDAARLHPALFAAAQTFLTGARDLDELELLQVLMSYSVYFGRPDLISRFLERAMDVALTEGWLDENSQVWRDLEEGDRARARRILAEIIASYKWSLLMVAKDMRQMRINLCRPTSSTTLLQEPIRLPTPSNVDLPLRIFRVRSSEELNVGRIYRDLMADFADLLPRVRRFLEATAVNTHASTEDALAQAARLQQDLQDWRLVKIPDANLRLPRAHEIDLDSPPSCHRAARALLLHSATTCIEGIITRHWLTIGRGGPPLQQFLHDECLLNAQRSFDGIPVVRALLDTRHAPFVSTFVICGLFNAATCFAIPLLRAIQARQWGNRAGLTRTEEHIHNLPTWPDESLGGLVIPVPSGSVPDSETIYHEADIKRYANNILVVLDMLSILHAFPSGQAARDRLDSLIQQFDLASAPHMRYPNPPAAWPAPEFEEQLGADMRELAGAAPSGMPEAIDPFPGMWDELLKLDPSVWEELLGGAGAESVAAV